MADNIATVGIILDHAQLLMASNQVNAAFRSMEQSADRVQKETAQLETASKRSAQALSEQGRAAQSAASSLTAFAGAGGALSRVLMDFAKQALAAGAAMLSFHAARSIVQATTQNVFSVAGKTPRAGGRRERAGLGARAVTPYRLTPLWAYVQS